MRTKVLVLGLLMAGGVACGTAGGGNEGSGGSGSSGGASSGSSGSGSGGTSGSSSGGTSSGGGTAGEWTLADGSNPSDLVEGVTFAYTVAVNLAAGTIGYADPVTLAPASAALPASGSTVVTLNADAANPATVTFTKDAFGFTIVASTPTDAFLRLALSGTYRGSLTLGGNRKLLLSLAGVTIESPDGPAINIQSSKRTFVVLEDGTTNRLADAGASASAPWTARTLPDGTAMDLGGTLFSEGPLVFSAGAAGTGSLVVDGLRAHAVASDAHVRVRGGTLAITSRGVTTVEGKDGIHARDAFVMDGGTVSITTTYGDGVQVEGNEDAVAPVGFVAVNGGSLTVSSYDDGIRTSFDPAATAAVETPVTADDPDPFIVVNGGAITIATRGPAADCLQSQSTLTVNGGTIAATTTGAGKAKGLQSVSTLTVNDGAITVATASPAAEGMKSTLGAVTVNGGTVEITAGEDGIAAETAVTINGGRTYVKSGSGDTDGIDSNGTMAVNGGVLVVVGSGTAPGDALDAGRGIAIAGGTFVAVGGMGVGGGPGGGGPGGGEGAVTATVDALKVTFSRTTWDGLAGRTLVLAAGTSTADALLAYPLPALATNQGIIVLVRHPRLAAGSTYGLFTGTGTASGGAFHGLAHDGAAVTGAWTSLGGFAATGGLVARSF